MDLLLTDANSVGHAAHRGTKLTAGALQTQAIFGMVRHVRERKLTNPSYVPLVLWDGRAQWRFDLHPDYKSNRKDTPDKVKERAAYHEQKPYIFELLKHLGVRQMTVTTHEADDLAGYFVHKTMIEPANKVKLDTGDQDWLQLIRPGVTWQDHRSTAKLPEITTANFYEHTGYKTPLAFLEGKCLQGDTSDVISGVGKMGEKGAPEFLAQFGSVMEFWRQVRDGKFVPKTKALQHLCTPEARSIFLRNLKLMQLHKVIPPKQENTKVEKGEFNPDAFLKLCEELAFRSITSSHENWLRPFH
jgi:5'-3' exonuclease